MITIFNHPIQLVALFQFQYELIINYLPQNQRPPIKHATLPSIFSIN